MTADQKDEQVEKLLAVVAQQKADIAKAEKPKWETNGSFGYNETTSARTNLLVVQDVEEIVKMYSFVLCEKDYYEKAADALGQAGTFTWLGYTADQWLADFKTRISKLQLAATKKKLEAAELALGKLVSKEKREEMELEALTKSLIG